ncbi:MAG: hypothetical protein JWR72_952 [Flavisolibacter sp.]|nr:hypothetical protein [Flavisolibacter sp.]
MKRNTPTLLLSIICCLFMASCNTATPEKCFDIAVLNSDFLVGFASDGQLSKLESPSIKMGKTKDEFAPMLRKEVINTKMAFIEETFEKIKDLQETTDTKDIRLASIALYEYVLPVYKTEYVALAKMYDEGASKEQTRAGGAAISNNHYSKFEELYGKLISSGKLYAEKNNIKLNRNVGRM